MWKALGEIVLRYRIILLAILLLLTVFMGWHASKVKLSYEFSKAIPTDNPKYKEYLDFKSKFGEDGTLLVIGVQTNQLFQQSVFADYVSLSHSLKKINGVEQTLSVANAVNLIKDVETEKLQAVPVFATLNLQQQAIDSSKSVFLSLPFYKGLLYNPQTNAWSMGVYINKNILASPKRTEVVNAIMQQVNAFGEKHKLEVHLSGLPLIRTLIADRIKNEMKWFTLISLGLSALILLLFFRSIGATLLSLGVVLIGVIWSFGTMELIGYKITLLTALIPPLVVVIGIPNCIYFLNKYHTAFKETNNKRDALVQMIGKMGVVTLFCNIAAAIGFAVFALTKSAILQEFGVVAGINIMALFFISLILIPAALSMMQVPGESQLKYLYNPLLQRSLDRLELWSLHHRKIIFGVTAVVLLFSIAGMFRLKSVGYIVDDLPKTDKIYTDLKFFESNFGGVMPLEIVIDTKQKNGLRKNMMQTFKGIDSLTTYLSSKPYIGKPLSIVEGLKFAKQAFFEGDSSNYSMPSEYDLPALAQYLSVRKDDSAAGKSSFNKLVGSFMDSTKREARISVTMKDIGSAQLPSVLNDVQQKSLQYFDSNKYHVQLTGASVTFLEGSRYIINGLKESIFWAFLLIAACMLYLFRSLRILLCSLIPNLIPLVITAGVMGWTGIALKPSTVLVFSVALGIAIDITIRFLVNYKQVISKEKSIERTVIETIHSTGLSIIYTSIVLIAGFVIFCFSSFGGTQSLGWLTSLTLITATIANLTLLPAIIISLYKKK
jgi:predicted RND superfamily exporter protein